MSQLLAELCAGLEAQALEAQAEAQARECEVASARADAVARVLTGESAPAEVQAVYTFRYDEILADSKLVDIIYSIEPDHRQSLARGLSHHSHTLQEYWWFIQIITPITRLPQELLYEILLITIDDMSHSPSALMRVCKLWYSLVSGIWASLKLGTTTPKDVVTNKLERNQRFLDVSVDTEFDRGDFTPSEGAYDAIFAAIQGISRWRSFVVETFPAQADLSEHLVDRRLQQCSNAVLSRLKTFKVKSACEMSPLLDRLSHILGTSASEELTTIEINSPDVISLLAPTYHSMFHSIKVLSLDARGLHNAVDFLPHLHQLEELTASHLSLPVYHKDVNIPIVHTLRHLTLRAVSIQWMGDRTFYTLESCTLLFPLHHHLFPPLSTTLPNCEHFVFQGYPLDLLDGVSARKLIKLSVTSPYSDKLRGNRQLVRFSSHGLRESRLAPRILRIGIEAMSRAWIQALAFMSNLEELVIGCAQPSSLGVKVLRSLVVRPVHANDMDSTATPGGWSLPICPSLKRFGLRYRRWLRPSEHFDLVPGIIPIVWSRQLSTLSLQSFRIWRGDQKDPLELIQESGINVTGLDCPDHGWRDLTSAVETSELLRGRGSHCVRNKIAMTSIFRDEHPVLLLPSDPGQVTPSVDDGMSQLHAPGPRIPFIDPPDERASGYTMQKGVDLRVQILEPTQILDNHIQYRGHVKIRIEVEPVSSIFKVVLVDPQEASFEANHLSDPSQLILYAKAYCASCAALSISDARRRCDPPTFLLPPSIESPVAMLMSFDDFKTRFSQIVTFKVPPRFRRPSNGQWFRCNCESLIISFVLKDYLGNDVAMYKVETPLRARTHQAAQTHQAVQPYQAVQPNLLALPHPSSNFGSTETTLPPPPPPQIVDIIPRSGPHSKGQRVWFKVQNLPRGNDMHYSVGFGELGIVGTSFVCSEDDEVQILECTTPITSTPCLVIPSLMHHYEPHIPLGSSDLCYEFASQS